MSKFQNENAREEVKSISERSSHSGSESGSGSGSGSGEEESEDGSEVNIDLSNNEFYKGMCTLLEDDNGNNIVQYIDLLCDHSAALVENTKHIEQMRVDIHRIAKCFERMVSLQEQMMGIKAASPPAVDESTVKRSKDDATVKSSKSHKTSSSKHH